MDFPISSPRWLRVFLFFCMIRWFRCKHSKFVAFVRYTLANFICDSQKPIRKTVKLATTCDRWWAMKVKMKSDIVGSICWMLFGSLADKCLLLFEDDYRHNVCVEEATLSIQMNSDQLELNAMQNNELLLVPHAPTSVSTFDFLCILTRLFNSILIPRASERSIY